MSFSRISATASRKADPLNRRIPENPRYKHVKPTIDTGASVSRYLQQLEEIRRDYRYRKDEIFKRLKVTTFAQLVLQIAGSEDASSVMQIDQEESTLLLSHRPASQLSADTNESPPSTARSTLSSVVVGMGELDVSGERDTSNDSTPPPVCPYLLLDVRDKEDFDQCHIVTAKSYPATMLSRSCNYFTKDILEYKNKPGRIIILYDEDERIAPQAVTTFVQREVDNVFLLSGGLKVLYKAFQEVMVAGKAPPSYLQSPPSTSYRTTSSSSSQKATVVSSAALTCSSQDKDKFSAGDLEVIRMNMDQVLSSAPGYCGSSRSSSRSSHCGSKNIQSGTRSSRTEPSGAASSRPWK